MSEPRREGTPISAREFERLIQSEKGVFEGWKTRFDLNGPSDTDALQAMLDSSKRLADRERIYMIYFHYPPGS